MGCLVTCDCGDEFEFDSPEEDMHYVWSVRYNGERSMLGNCPKVHGMSKAAGKARSFLSGKAMYQGRII